jgi:tetratricopeptide (TPR) repeat protein
MDADMTLRTAPHLKTKDQIQEWKRSHLSTAYAHHLFQGDDTFQYKNVRILQNHTQNHYWGVTHEYTVLPPNTEAGLVSTDELFIVDIGDGGSKADKFERDIRLLVKGLEELPDNDRYLFYLANSYKDAGQKEKAIETYQRKVSVPSWVEEKYISYLEMGKCYRDLGRMPEAIGAWMKGYEVLPERCETI